MSTLAVDSITDTQGSALLGRRNVIINGNFGINQRGVSGTVTLSAGAYGHDRWKAGASGCTYTFATSENITTLTITAGSLIQVVEGLNVVSGTHVLSWTGTAQGKIGAGSYGDSGITGSVTGGSNLNIEFGTGTVSKVQLEVGSVATPFEHRSYGEELALCQRYYFKMEGIAQDAAFGSGAPFASTLADVVIHFPVTMRSSPTALEQSGTAGDYRGRFGSTISTLTTVPLFTGKCTPTTARVRATASGWTVGHGGALLANNANAFLAWSAEL